jgi:MYXO-CTERM domain-containing protein
MIKPQRRRVLASLGLISALAALIASPIPARAEVPPQRTFYRLPSSNGHGAILLDLQQGVLTHFHEHLNASEEPLLDASGNEVWNGNQPQSVITRDLLFDAYFGLRSAGNQKWLKKVPVDLDKSGYASWASGKTGGTGVISMVQTDGAIRATQLFFAPRGMPRNGFVMVVHLENTGAAPVPGVSAFSIHNFHLGYGRYGAIADLQTQDIGENGETISFDGSGGKADFLEKAFAGVVVARALGLPAHHGASNGASAPAANVFNIVDGGGAADLPDLAGAAPTADGSVSAYQFDIGTLAPGADAWAGVAFAHDGDPQAGAAVQKWLDTYVAGKGAKALVDEEIAGWAAFQGALTVPKGLSADEETLLRQSAVMLAMAQNEEDTTFLREHLANDGDQRYTRFGATAGTKNAQLPATIVHKGKGAVLASLPPGEWQVAWIRDGSYAATAMATLGMKAQAKEALQYYVNAEAGRFQTWNELKPYSMPPYQISLVRYYGFGVEETDFNDFGPNLEFDGFGLFLWALGHYESKTGDKTLVDGAWPVVSTKVADVLVALVDPATGLLRKDSSIWESHWNGRERSWTYSNITAVRGLCDAATLATRVGDLARAKTYQDTATALRSAIAQKLTDPSHALASNAEELATGEGYWDAAVLDGIAFGLFDPNGQIAKATLAGLDAHLAAPAGAGWSRNDDRSDHQNGNDVSPWGSEYDSAEWVVTDLRGAVAARRMGDTARSDKLLAWVRDQSLLNYLAISETYDEGTGQYKFNAPMVGFGAGVYALALAEREAPLDAPACGAYFDETTLSTATSSGSETATAAATTGSSGTGGAGGTGGSGSSGESTSGCGCTTAPHPGSGLAALALLALAAGRARRRARAR